MPERLIRFCGLAEQHMHTNVYAVGMLVVVHYLYL